MANHGLLSFRHAEFFDTQKESLELRVSNTFLSVLKHFEKKMSKTQQTIVKLIVCCF